MASAVLSLSFPFGSRELAKRPALHEVSSGETPSQAGPIRQLSRSLGVEPESMRSWDAVTGSRVRLHKGETLFHIGDPFASLYVVRSGSCKTVLLSVEGVEHVAGFHMAGDVVGIDGLGEDRHACRAIALEDAELWAVPFDRIRAVASNDAAFQRSLHWLLSREIARGQNAMLMLGTMRAEQRVASFLLDLACRYAAHGYSSTEFVLRMTREEIGSHLGLTLETVSRLFSRFQQSGVLQVQGRVVKLLDRLALKRVVNSCES